MKYYSRESERCQSRIAELERQKSRCEAGLAAMEACWAQVKIFRSIHFRPPADLFAKLIDVIGSLVQPEQLPSIQLDMRRTFRVRSPSDPSPHLSIEIFDLSRHIPDDPENTNYLTEAFNSRLDATEKLVSAFISICGKGTSGFQQEDLLSKYHAAQSEVRREYPTPVDRCSVPTTSRQRAFTRNWQCYDLNLPKRRHRRNSTSTISSSPSHASTGSAARPFRPWLPPPNQMETLFNTTSLIQMPKARSPPLLQ